MKMAENPIMLSFQNNCESINSNCVEVVHDQNTEKIINGDITTTTTEINNSEDDPNMEKPEDSTVILEKSSIPDDNDGSSSNNNNNEDNDNKTESTTSSIMITTQEGTSINDDFLAGESKTQLHHHNTDDVEDDDDDLLLANIETDNDDGIVFKTDNVIIDCTEIEEKNDFNDEDDDDDDDDDGGGIVCEDDNGDIEDDKIVEETFDIGVEENECNNLTKMQIMEEVHEGSSSNIQPSSPGHAEERSSTKEQIQQPIKTEETEENGFDDENCVNGDEIVEESKPLVNDEIKEEKSESEIVIKSENTSNCTMNEDNSNTNSSEESQTNNVKNNNNSSSNNKRKSDTNESPTKRLRLEIQENFINRDKILNEFIELADCNNIEQIQLQTEQILAEIRTLNDMAKEKEREWNNIIHLKKMKEELLLRIQRRKQVILLTNDNKTDNIINDTGNYESQNQEILKNNHQSILKTNLTNQKRAEQQQQRTSNKNRSILPKASQQYSQIELNGDYKQQQQQQQNKNRPILDVQSIIADYRQRHPETVPRRGRRIRRSGSQVHHNVQGMDSNNDVGILLNAIDTNRNENSQVSSSETSQTNELSFKDMLIQFARLSQSERNELIQNAIKPPPPPYPEVTVHPVPATTTVAPVSNSLLHGILTKNTSSKTNTKTSFSPTLARLLTAPERGNNGHGPVPNLPNNLLPHQSTANMSISEILSTSKARNEITITPVGAQYDNLIKNKNHMEEDEAEDSADRLVIDESNENDNRSRGGGGGNGNVGDNNSDVGDEVPQCQGCNQKSALFVCAGCGNQWYCSRDCQVSAWDEHSEVCSG